MVGRAGDRNKGRGGAHEALVRTHRLYWALAEGVLVAKTKPAKDAGSKQYVDIARPEDAGRRRFAATRLTRR